MSRACQPVGRPFAAALAIAGTIVWLGGALAVAHGDDGAGTRERRQQALPAHVLPSSWRWWLSVTDQGGPPPPSLRPYLPQFIPLYTSYRWLPAHAKQPSFSVWLIMNGVVDPTTHQAMLLLYTWAERNSG